MYLRHMVTAIRRGNFSGYQGVEISTCLTIDAGWETALFYPNTHHSKVVEHYDNENDAIAGHLKHVKDQLTK